MAIQQSITKPLASAASSWIGTAISAVASANGNVFDGSAGLSAYSGQVVSKPTVFPFAKGVGLMGEAGPEAILPLSRGSDGKLGVKGGSGGAVVNITINDNGTKADSSGDASGAWSAFAQRIKGLVLDEMTTQKRPGGLLYV